MLGETAPALKKFCSNRKGEKDVSKHNANVIAWHVLFTCSDPNPNTNSWIIQSPARPAASEGKRIVLVSRVSTITGMAHVRELDITIEQLNAWQNASGNDPNRFAQNAFPNLPAEDREFLISGITLEEWTEFFGDYDDFD